jgi:capsular exopolysaccharide synthesis family protein
MNNTPSSPPPSPPNPGEQLSAHFRGQGDGKTVQLQNQEELSIRDYFDIVSRHKITLALFVLLGLIGAIAIHFVTPAKFSSEASLVQSGAMGGAMNSPMMSLMGGGGSKSLGLSTYRELIRSTAVLEDAIRRIPKHVQLLTDKNQKLNTIEEAFVQQVTIDSIKDKVQLSEKNGKDIILVQSNNVDMPIVSAILCNVISEALINRLKQDKQKSFLRQIEHLNLNIEKNQVAIKDTEASIKAILGSQQDVSNLFVAEDQLLKQIAQTKQLLDKAQLERQTLENQSRNLRSEFGLGQRPLKQFSWITTSSPLYRKLEELRIQRAELLTRYKPANPTVKKIEFEIEATEKTLKPLLTQGITYIEVPPIKMNFVSQLMGLEGEIKAVAKRSSYLESKIEQLEQQLRHPTKEQRELQGHEQELLVLKDAQLESHKALHTIKMQLLSAQSELDVLEKASPNFISKGPNLIKLLAMGLMIGMGIGIASALLLNNWSNTLNNTIDLKRHFNLPIMGAFPKWDDESKHIDEMEPDSPLAEAYAVARNNLRFSSLKDAENALLVVSPAQGEGKSLTAINLALSFALEGSSALLISADLRKPEPLTRFRSDGDEEKALDLSDYLNGDVDKEGVIFQSNISNFDFIPTSRKVDNPTKLLKSDRLKELIDFCKGKYDAVIIDSPALLPVVDACILSAHINGALIIARAEKTTTTDIQSCLSRLEHVGCPLAGISLNGIKYLKGESFYGYGQSDYRAYYS